MSKQILVIVIAVAAALILALGLSSIAKKGGEESSAEESSAAVTDVIIVPSEMPARISFNVPPGFTETRSDAFDKYYTRDDASVIITGEELIIHGIMLEEYTARVMEQYESTADEYQLISDDAMQLSGELPCRVLEFSYAIVGEDVHQKMQCITAVLLKDNYAYIVTCKSKKENFQLYRAAFLQMIESITVADKDSGASDPQTPSSETVPAAQSVS